MSAAASPSTARPGQAGIDPRGPRFGAGLTAVLLVVVLLLGASTAGLVVLGVVVASFAIGAARGTQGTWQGALYKALVRPRLAAPAELEDPAPPRFAQVVGLVIAGTGLALALLGVPWALEVAAGAALVAAFLNAVVGLCLGCELYLVLTRLRNR